MLVAQACNVGYAPLVDETVPALREARLKYVARHYIRPETLIAANARIVDYHAALELATRWGRGEVASIDGLRFVVPNRTIHAGFNRRYYHRRRGVTALTTTADHHATMHTVVVPGTKPDALFLLDAAPAHPRPAQPPRYPPLARPRGLPRPPRRAAPALYRQGHEEQLTALGLVVNCIALYNSLYPSGPSTTSPPPGTPSATRTSNASAPLGTSTSPSPGANPPRPRRTS